jgi:hypothetical protein
VVVAFVYTPAHPWLRVLLLALLFRPMAAMHITTAKAVRKESRLGAKAVMARLQHMPGARASCNAFDTAAHKPVFIAGGGYETDSKFSRWLSLNLVEI